MRKYDLVCFDMDGVLTKVRSSWCWIHECFEVDNEPAYQAYCNGEIDEPEFMRRDIKLWTDKKPDVTVRDIAVMFRDMPLIEGIQETIACLRDNGIRSVIVSGGIDHAAKMIAEEFGFDGYIADEICSNPDGTLTGEGKLNVDLRDKGINVRGFIEKYGTTADFSHTDRVSSPGRPGCSGRRNPCSESKRSEPASGRLPVIEKTPYLSYKIPS